MAMVETLPFEVLMEDLSLGFGGTNPKKKTENEIEPWEKTGKEKHK
jgi:hypothetical protein